MSGECQKCWEHCLDCRCRGKNMYHRCPKCFCRWIDPETEHADDASNKQCRVCEENPYMTSIALLKRMIEVLETTSLSDFPKFMSHFVKHIKIE